MSSDRFTDQQTQLKQNSDVHSVLEESVGFTKLSKKFEPFYNYFEWSSINM